MTYNRANSSISKAYNSMYKNVIKRNILESSDNNQPTLSDIKKVYLQLVEKLSSAENGKKLLWEITKNFDVPQLYNFASSFTYVPMRLNGNHNVYPSHDDIWTHMINHFYTSGSWEDKGLKGKNKNDLYTKIFPYINSQEIADNIKKSIGTDIDIPVYTQIGKSGPVVTPTDPTTGNEPKTKEDLEAEKEEKEEGGAEQSDSKTDKSDSKTEQSDSKTDKSDSKTEQSDSKTDKSDNSTGDSGGSTELPKASDGKDDTTNKNKKPVEVEIPDISIEVVNAYREDLESKVNVLKNIRERIRTILQLQSEMINQFRNPQGSQQGQYQQQMYDGRDWTPTTVPTYQQGHQGDAHYQQAPQTQQQKGQPQQQNTSKQDDDEGFLSKAWNGIKKAGSGVLDVASAPIGAVKDGLDAASDWLSKE